MPPGPSAPRYSCARKSAASAGWACWWCVSGLRLSGSAAGRRLGPAKKSGIILTDPYKSNLRLLWFLWIRLGGRANLDGRAEPLVVRIVHGDSHMHIVTGFKVQHIICARVSREPIVAFDILAVVLKMRKSVVVFLPDQPGGGARGFDNLKVLVIHPHAPFEVSLAFLQFSGFEVENVSVEFID